MNQEDRELLIRLDTRQANMEKTIEAMGKKLEGRRCHTHAEKIRTLEKITWAAVLASLAAIVKSFWISISGGVQ